MALAVYDRLLAW